MSLVVDATTTGSLAISSTSEEVHWSESVGAEREGHDGHTSVKTSVEEIPLTCAASSVWITAESVDGTLEIVSAVTHASSHVPPYSDSTAHAVGVESMDVLHVDVV